MPGFVEPETGGKTAEDALSSYLREECRSALLGELSLRDEVTVDGVHDTRVSIRRVRSTLRLFADLLEPEAVALDEELRWLAGLLSDVRDADVLRHHLETKLDELPAELVMGRTQDDLDEAIGQDRDAALRRWREARDSDRYVAVLGALAQWSRRPPLRRPLDDQQLEKQGEKVLMTAEHKAAERLRLADDDAELTHRARKAVKRLRYAADLLQDVVPGAGPLSERAQDVQSLLGDHQDLMVQAAFLRHQAARVGARERHHGFTYGLLMARAEREAADIRASEPRI